LQRGWPAAIPLPGRGRTIAGIAGDRLAAAGPGRGGGVDEEEQVTQLDADTQHHPVVVAHKEHRAADAQLRVADAITAFAGSMRFVYIHAVVFGLWMVLVEPDPWPKLTLVVSLEAIFLSAFVLIGQNRQAAFQVAKADHDFIAQEQELRANTDLTRAIHTLAVEIHARVVTDADGR
jgi:uncharacterized membrane protein